MRAGIDGHGHRAKVADEAVDEPVSGGIAVRERREKPGRALEEIGRRVSGAARLRAADRVAADEPRRARRRLADRGLRRADVGHGAVVGARLQHGAHLRRQLSHRHGDHGELGAAERFAQSRLDLVDRAPLERELGRGLVLVEPGDRCAGPLRGQPDRGADQPGADDREPQAALSDLLAHEGDELGHLSGELAELVGRDLLRAVAERLLGPADAPRR